MTERLRYICDLKRPTMTALSIRRIILLFALFVPYVDSMASGDLSLLEDAIENGDLAVVNGFIKDGGSVNVEISGWPLICIAANHNQNSVLKLLLDSGADVNRENHRGDTALILAAYNKYQNSLSILLAANADPDIVGLDGKSALMWSVIKDDLESVELLLNSGASVNGPSGHTSRKWKTSARGAYKSGRIGAPPLILAVANENIEIVKLLLSKGASPNITDAVCDSAYTYAKLRSNRELEGLLMQSGASHKDAEDCLRKERIIVWLLILISVIGVIGGIARSMRSKRNSAFYVITILLNGFLGALVVLLVPPSRLSGDITDILLGLFMILVIGNTWVVARSRRIVIAIIFFVLNTIGATLMLLYIFSFDAEEFAMGGLFAILCLFALGFASKAIYYTVNSSTKLTMP